MRLRHVVRDLTAKRPLRADASVSGRSWQGVFCTLSLAGTLGAYITLAQAADVTLTDLRYTAGPLTYRLPTLVIRGTRASRDELTRLVDAAAAGNLDVLRALDAEEISVPEITAETGQADRRVAITTRDIRASAIRAGRVASIMAGGSEILAVPAGAKPQDGVLRGGIGRMAIQDLDLALAASLTEPGTGEALQVLYGSVTLEAVRLTDPSGAMLRLDRLTSRDVRARRTTTGWAAAVAALSAATGPVPADRLAAILADWAGSVRLGSFEAGGLGFELAGPDRQAARIGRIGYAEGTIALNLDDVEVGGADGRLTVAHATLEGVASGIAAAQGGREALRGLLPSSGSIRLDTVVLAGPDRNAATVGRVELGVMRPAAAADAPTTDAPSALSFAARDIAMPLALPNSKPLIDLGYARLEGSIEGAATYDAPREELSVERLRLRADGMGEIGVGARFAKVSPDLFQRDATLAARALLDTRVRSLDIAIENGGLAERLVDRQARLTGAKPDDVSRQYGAAAGFGVLMTLGPAPGAQTLGTALARFVTKPGRLAVTVTAKDAAGLSVADLVMSPDPRAILDQVDVAASAE